MSEEQNELTRLAKLTAKRHETAAAKLRLREEVYCQVKCEGRIRISRHLLEQMFDAPDTTENFLLAAGGCRAVDNIKVQLGRWCASNGFEFNFSWTMPEEIEIVDASRNEFGHQIYFDSPPASIEAFNENPARAFSEAGFDVSKLREMLERKSSFPGGGLAPDEEVLRMAIFGASASATASILDSPGHALETWTCERGCGYEGNLSERVTCEVCGRGRGD